MMSVLIPLVCFRQPFVDSDHFVQDYFPERYWGIAASLGIGTVWLAAGLTLISLLLIRSGSGDVYHRPLEGIRNEENLSNSDDSSCHGGGRDSYVGEEDEEDT